MRVGIWIGLLLYVCGVQDFSLFLSNRIANSWLFSDFGAKLYDWLKLQLKMWFLSELVDNQIAHWHIYNLIADFHLNVATTTVKVMSVEMTPKLIKNRLGYSYGCYKKILSPVLV